MDKSDDKTNGLGSGVATLAAARDGETYIGSRPMAEADVWNSDNGGVDFRTLSWPKAAALETKLQIGLGILSIVGVVQAHIADSTAVRTAHFGPRRRSLCGRMSRFLCFL
jgi:hypothetical protein